ncbi:T9SS type A sorting domain-containing protein [bacterium]|nr:T9SS type A sorting domain-containing protein [bacterium]
MFIGDSITYGKGCMPGFRDDVYWALKNMGFPFEFVGSVNETPPFRGYYFNSAQSPDFFRRTGKHYMAGEMDRWRPTILVIHLGTNDFWLDTWIQGGPYSRDGGQTFTSQVSGNLAKLLAFLTQWHDGREGTHLKTIFLCQIIPKTSRHMGPAGIPMLNEDLVQMILDIEAGRVPSIPPGLVRLVDQFTGFTSEMFYDDNHPNCKGYNFMTKNFIDAFKMFPMHLIADTGWNQRVLPGDTLQESLTFRVTDGFGNSVPGVPVRLEVVYGDAVILSPLEAVSDTSGQIYVDMALGWTDSSIVKAYSQGLIDSMTTGTLHSRDHVLLSGKIDYYGSAQPVSDVEIRWEQESRVTYSYSDGSFEMDGVGLKASPMLVPSKEKACQENINMTIIKAAVIARHVVGIEPFSKMQELAADVDGDGVVQIQDAVTIARLVVGLTSIDSTSVGQWRFWPSSTTCDSVTADIDSLHFTGICIGDFQPDSSPPGNDGVTFAIGESELAKTKNTDETIHIPIWMNGESIVAGQFTAIWDTNEIKLVDVESMNREFHIVYHSPVPGRAHVALFSAEPVSGDIHLATLCFRGKNGIRLPRISIEEAVVNHLTVADIPREPPITESDFKLGTNYPNPFNGQTVFPVHLKKEGPVNLLVVNILGQKIKTLFQGGKAAGTDRIIWDGRDESGNEVPSGIYFFIIENGKHRMVQRMEVIR